MRGRIDISGTIAIAAAMLPFACAACSRHPEGARSATIARLRAITDKCGLPPSALKLFGKDDLGILPAPATKFEKVDCLLLELRKAKLRLKMGFIGNAPYGPGENNAPAH